MSAMSALVLAASTVLPCGAQSIPVGGSLLWVDQRGSGTVTVLLEAGNGADSTVWDGLEPQIRALGVRTFRYDRQGYRNSAPRPGRSYRVEMDLAAVRTALDYCQVSGPVIEVAHSYGGALALLGAARDRRIAGIVLVDAMAPGVENQASVAETLAELRPQYAAVRKQVPQLAETLIPVVEAIPRTIARLNATDVGSRLPIIDIVADGGKKDRADAVARWRAGHRAFVAAAPESRTYVDAGSSGHQVMQDRPDLVLAAIRTMLARIEAGGPAR